MGIQIYNDEEIEKLREGGSILSRILGELVLMAGPGVTTQELDEYAEKEMRLAGGEPSFKGYKAGGDVPFCGTVCTSINNEVVHGPPLPSRTLKESDLLKMDIGFRYKGLCTDMAVTVPIGEVSDTAKRLMKATRASLLTGIDVIKPGAEIGDIGRAVQKVIDKEGFGIVRDLVGHGVGRSVHEDPQIPNYDNSNLPTVKIKKGMVLAVEPMINEGSWKVDVADDEWTIITADKSLSSHFEVTLAVTKDGYEILTPLPV